MSSTNRDWTVLRMLEWATDYFEKKKIPDPRHSIEWLLAYVLDIKRLDLYLKFDRPLGRKELDQLRKLVKRRAAHEPLQYIVGHTDFMNCRIDVNPSVLIPRIETEQLVEHLLERTSDRKNTPINLLDIGTGSGCIPISIKKENPGWNCCGIDISIEALKVAAQNSVSNDVEVNFFEGDLFNLDDHKKINEIPWDIIISNPPYIHPDEKPEINKQVLDYEPSEALFVDDPMSVYKSILSFSKKQNADLFLECNDKTAEEVKHEAEELFGSVELLKDLDKNPRFIVAI